MASLALMVGLIFLIVIFIGPVALMMHKLGFRKIATILAVLAVVIGGYWAVVAPFPISIVGGISAFIGLTTINRY